MPTIGEALVKFSSDATSTLKAMQSVSDGAKDANEKGSAALDTFKKKMGESVDASKEFSKVFLEGAAVVGVAAVGFAVKSVEAYNEHEQALTQMNAALKSTGGAAEQSAKQITDHAEALQHSTGASRDAIMAGQNMLLTFTEIKGKTFPETTQAVLDMATAMNGGMLPNAEQMREKALQMGKALNDPIHGFNMLKREGVTFSEAQKETIKAMEATHDVGKQQDIMLKELAREFGGSAEAAGTTFAGQIAKAKNALNDVMVAVGKLIVDHLTPLVNKFNEWFEKAGGVDGVMKLLNKTVEQAISWAKKHYDLLLLIVGAIAGPLVVALGSWLAGLVSVALAIAPVLIAGALVMGLIELWVNHVGGLHNAMEILRSKIEELTSFVKDSIAWFKDHMVVVYALGGVLAGIAVLIAGLLVSAFVAWAISAGAAAIATIAATWPLILLGLALAAAGAAMFALGYTIYKNWDMIKSYFQQGIGYISGQWGLFKEGLAAIGDFFKGVMDGIKKSMAAGVNDIIKGINVIIDAYDKVAANIPGGSHITIKDIPGFASGVQNFSGGLAVVGENGPELVKLPSGSDVIPNHEVGKQLASNGSSSGHTSGSSTNVVANVGIFLGTPGEFRSFAERIQVEINRLNSARGI